MCTNLRSIRSTQPTSSCRVVLANLWWNVCKNRIENRTFHGLIVVIGSACLLVFKLDVLYTSSWILFTIECREYLLVFKDSCCKVNVYGCYLVRFSCAPSFDRLNLHNQLCRVALANLRWNVCKNRIENRASHGLVMVIGITYLLVSKLDVLYRFSWVSFAIKCRE